MKMLKYFPKIIGAFALSLVIFMGSPVWAKTLKFAHVYETSHPLHAGALEAAKLLKAQTSGRWEIEVFPASSLGKEVALNEGVSLGTVDIIYTGASFAGAAVYGPLAISSYPFTLRNLAHWRGYANSDLFEELSSEYQKRTGGNSIMAISYYGARHVTANKPVRTPADMVGLKIRVPAAPAFVLFPEAVGANPTPMAFAEVYLALQQKVVDAQENPLPTIQAKKFYEVQSDINLTGHIINSILTIVSSSTLSSMSRRDRATLGRVLNETASQVTAAVAKSEEELADWFRGKGVKVNVVNREPFIAAVAPHLTKGGDLPFSKEQYERLQAIPDAN